MALDLPFVHLLQYFPEIVIVVNDRRVLQSRLVHTYAPTPPQKTCHTAKGANDETPQLSSILLGPSQETSRVRTAATGVTSRVRTAATGTATGVTDGEQPGVAYAVHHVSAVRVEEYVFNDQAQLVFVQVPSRCQAWLIRVGAFMRAYVYL